MSSIRGKDGNKDKSAGTKACKNVEVKRIFNKYENSEIF